MLNPMGGSLWEGTRILQTLNFGMDFFGLKHISDITRGAYKGISVVIRVFAALNPNQLTLGGYADTKFEVVFFGLEIT